MNEWWSFSQSSLFCSILGLFTVCLGRALCVEIIELWRFGDVFTCEPVKVNGVAVLTQCLLRFCRLGRKGCYPVVAAYDTEMDSLHSLKSNENGYLMV